MVTNPSIVIGVGEAGCKMAARTYHSIVEEADGDKEAASDVLNRFKFVGIDTKQDEVEEYTPDAFETYALETPNEYWEMDLEEYPYLREDMTLTDVGGATRQRGVSRYYIDNLVNYEEFYYRLQRIVDDFEDMTGQHLDADEIAAANVWIVNSFGGGTGSGAFPLIAGMLDQITRSASEDYYLCGIGSLPRINQLDEQTPPPNANVSFYANAYTAIRELGVLLDYDFADGFTDAGGVDYPVTLPVYATRNYDELTGFNDIILDEPPFDFYGLLGFDEEEANERSDYSKNLNQVAADLIRLMSEEYGEDFPNDYSRDGVTSGKPTLYSVDSRGVRVPVSDVEDYVEALENIQEIDDRLEDNKDEVERLRENRNYINQVRDIDPGHNPYEESHADDIKSLLVGQSLIERAQATAEEVNPRGGFQEEQLDERFENAFAEVGRIPERYDFDAEVVFAYLYYQEVVSNLRSMKEGHAFAQQVEEAIDVYGGKFSSYLDTDQLDVLNSNAGPLEKWKGGLEEFFEEAIDDQEEKHEQTSMLKIRVRNEIKERIERLTNTWKDLVDEYTQYRNIDDAQNSAKGRRNEARTQLEDRREAVSDEIREAEEQIETLQAERGRRKNVQETRRETLSNYSRERFMSIPFQDFENASVEFLSDLDDINDLLDKRIVTKRKLARALEYQIGHLEEPLQDMDAYNVAANEYSHLGVLVSDANESLVEGYLDGIEGIADISSELAGVANEQTRANIDDPFRIRLTMSTADIRLENTSEFGQIHSYYSDRNLDVGSLLGSSSDDVDLVGQKFGYPELFPEDEQVNEAFGKQAEKPETAED